MTTQTLNQNTTQNSFSTTPVGTTIPFESINDCGAYICNWSGHLLRVPEDGVIPGRSPAVNMVGPQPLTVTKISDNPFITVTKAKLLASNYDLAVNF
ncbi:MAG: hypothetical protein HRF50_03270 [Phycisphaerae bacterium]|jgi:hypothetical protein